MTAKGWGRIINIASAHGLVASGEKAAYVTAKHGLVGLTKVIAIEVANQGVTCNAICPGWVLTALVQKQIEARAAAQGIPYQQAHDDLLREKQPMLQYTTPEKIARARRVSVRRSGLDDDRRGAVDRRRLGCPVATGYRPAPAPNPRLR